MAGGIVGLVGGGGGISTTAAGGFPNTNSNINRMRTTSPKYLAIKIRCIGWDPEGILGPPSTGHLARREFQRRLEKDSEAREEFQRQLQQEKERRRALRMSRRVPESHAELVEYFLDTEAQELELEIARMRLKLTDEFFTHLKFELGQLRFAVQKTEDMEDRVIELEALQKALLEGIAAYDKLQANIVKAKDNLNKIFTSKDVQATLLDMVEKNEINKSLLALLDENIASALRNDQIKAAEYMDKIRSAVRKYYTV
uniref:uncharacterized protein LOC122610029 n=1 Tax=Erigeron canadensis TaxID=72917 RepID=UPI001CB969BD|nr:uncharacterized protein LOC122610029 [Erigeron canadensis]